MWSLTVSPQIINSPSLEKAPPNVHSANESRQGTFGWSRYALVICYRDQNKCRSHLLIRSSKPPNQKGWETLRCGLEQYFDLAQLLICRWEGKGRTPPVIYVALLNRSNPFEVKAIWGANQHTTPPPPSFGFVWKWTQKCEKPDEGKQSIILTYVPAFENGCVMTNVVLIINPMPFPHLPVS